MCGIGGSQMLAMFVWLMLAQSQVVDVSDYCEERIYCYTVILLSPVKICKANVEIIYSLVLTSLSRKQPVDLLSVNLFVKS